MRKCIILLLSLFLFSRIYSQVNMQTGSAVFNLPIFNWQDDKSRLTSLVALDYNSGSGLKVNDVASNVGQGWNLVAGGVISRMQVGEPDDQKPYLSREPEDVDDRYKYPAGYLYSTTDPKEGIPFQAVKYPLFKDKNHVYKKYNSVTEDKEPDYFAFQFNGKSGLFVLGKDAGDVCLFIGDTRMKGWFERDEKDAETQNLRTTISAFYIQDEDGMTYKFSKLGWTRLLRKRYFDASLLDRTNHEVLYNATEAYQTQPNFKKKKVYQEGDFYDNEMHNPNVVTEWHLTEITDPVTGRSISLTYNDETIESPAGTDLSYYSTGNYGIVSHKFSNAHTSKIASIIYPDGHSVLFNYGSERVDLNGDKVLSSIDVKFHEHDLDKDGYISKDRYLSEHIFNTSYFILNRYGTPTSWYEKKIARLCLLSVKKIGVDLKEDNPPFLFDYYTSTGTTNTDDVIPPAFCSTKDIWGFYNGDYSKDADDNPIQLSDDYNCTKISTDVAKLSYQQIAGLCFLRNDNFGNMTYNAKPGYAKNGLLKQIVYPTGGSLQYGYKQNEGIIRERTTSELSKNMYVGGVHVSQVSSSDGGSSNGCDNQIITEYRYNSTQDNRTNEDDEDILVENRTSSLWSYKSALEAPNNRVIMENDYSPEKRKYKYSVPFGKCYYVFQYPGLLESEDKVNLNNFQEIMQAIAPVLNVVSTASQVLDIIMLCANGTGWGAVIIDAIIGLYDVISTCLVNAGKTYNTTVFYNSDLNGGNPLPVQFKRAEVIPRYGGIGRTVYEYTSDDKTDDNGYDIWVPYNDPDANGAYSQKQRYASWAYGLLKKATVYRLSDDKENPLRKVKETENIYDYLSEVPCDKNVDCDPKIKHPFQLPQYSKVWGCKSFMKKNVSQRSEYWDDASAYTYPDQYTQTATGDMNVDIYEIYTGRAELKTNYERVYNADDDSKYAETETDYTYNDAGWDGATNFDVNTIITTKSNGEKEKKQIYYDCNMFSEPYYTMKDNNIWSVPVQTITSLVKVDPDFDDGRTMDENIESKGTEYTQLNNNGILGDIKPLNQVEQRFSKPERDGAWQLFTVPQGSEQDYGLTVTKTFSYDQSTGSLTGMKDEGGHAVTNKYDYDDKYVVATIINADPAKDASDYTSFETNNLDDWTVSGTISYDEKNSVTGNRSLILDGMDLFSTGTHPMNIDKPYKLSFWATGNVTIEPQTQLITQMQGINGFTYYEYNVEKGADHVIIHGSGSIDELRLYPTTARMRTITYDPLIGKTSECDENNRITYYEYDNLGRLRFVKDENKNILKMNEYNTASNQAGCPGLYYNHAITEIFTKNNCGDDYQGGEYTYTIPPARYESKISQADADAQADEELVSDGQELANSDPTVKCYKLFYNIAKSEDFIKEGCDDGYKGTSVSYSVPARRYVFVNYANESDEAAQAEADQLAQDEIDANGQGYANQSGIAACIIDTDPDWEADDEPLYKCDGDVQSVHVTDVNPNSGSYGTSDWKPTGIEGACTPVPPSVNITGTTYFGAGNYSNTGFITATAGTLVTVNIGAGGGSIYSGGEYKLSVGVWEYTSGDISITGNTQVTNNNTSFTFIMPSSGSVHWTGSFSETDDDGGGNISVQ